MEANREFGAIRTDALFQSAYSDITRAYGATPPERRRALRHLRAVLEEIERRGR